MTAYIKSILICAEQGLAMQSVEQAELVSGKGIKHDRYYSSLGFDDKKRKDDADFEITLIEQEQIDYFNHQTHYEYSGLDFRRNIVTQGIELNALMGKIFTIGHVTLKGISLCEPCAQLSRQLGSEIMQYMVHKSGLRAQILTDGRINVRDKLTLKQN